MSKPPNILFLQVDQLTADVLSCYGGDYAITPNLNRLAARSAIFDNAYCNYPLCSPSRASMATGKLCSEIGAYDNGAEFRAELPTYAHYLRAAGYFTALSGKMHFIGPDQYHGFEARLTPDLYPADYSWAPNWGNEGKRDTNDPRAVTIAGVCQRNAQTDFDDLTAQKAVRFLQDYTDPRPFFLQVSFTHPHEPYLCRQEYWELYEGRDVPQPRVPKLPADQLDAHSHRLMSDFGLLEAEFTQDQLNTAIRGYFGALSYVDDLIGQVIDALEASGQAQNTYILFTSDHGEMLGERGLWFKKHFFEKSLRVPLLLAGPDIAPQHVSELCSLLDLLPSFNAMGDGPNLAEPLMGMDLRRLLDQGNPAPQRPVYAEYLAEATPAPILMIRRGNLKFITSSHDGHMLFDLADDPCELTNLAEHPDYETQLETFIHERDRIWDVDAITAQIKASQARRTLLRTAMAQGSPTRWNHGETPDQDVPWYRGGTGYNEWAFDYD